MIMLYGAPGVGKTTKLLELYIKMVEVHGPDRVAMITYTRAAAQEVRSRVAAYFKCDEKKLVLISTIHSACYRLLESPAMVDGRKGRFHEFCRELNLQVPSELDFSPDDMNPFWYADLETRHEAHVFRRLYSQVRHTGGTQLPDGVDYELMDQERFDELRVLYEGWKARENVLDFEDLLVHGAERALDVRVLLVDEVQDNSQLMWDVTESWARDLELFVVAGDLFQCQPPGTPVLTSNGYKAIQNLDPKTDRLLSYVRRGSYMVGFQHPYEFKIAHRNYRGDLIRVAAGEKATETTPEHRWPFMWSKKAHAPGTTVVYLQRKGDRWRVGWCQLFGSQTNLHWATRARLEDADDAWILKSFDNKTDASIYESYVSLTWGLPTLPFREIKGATHLTRAAIDKFFDMLSATEQGLHAVGCLTAHGRDSRYPLWSKNKKWERIGVRTQGETQACNLIDGLMCVLVLQEDYSDRKYRQRATFQPLTTSRRPYEGEVYSLEVKPHELYIADGLVTHNSIYQFVGADPDLFAARARRPGTELIALGNSHRLTSQAASYAKSLLDEGGFDPEQKALLTTWEGANDLTSPGDQSVFYLARTHNLLSRVRQQLLDGGVPFSDLRGNSLLTSSEGRAFRTFMCIQEGDVTSGDELIRAALAAGQKIPKQAGEQDSLVDAERAAQLMGIPVEQAVKRIKHADYLQEVYKHHGLRGLIVPPKIKLGTIHSAKGREADIVHLITSWAFRPARARWHSEAGRRSEACVAYVAASRHRQELVLHEGEPGERYPF